MLSALIATAACSSSTKADADPFDTFQLCFDDHTSTTGDHLPADQAIAVCCLDHPIGGNAAGVVCGTDAASCTTYVTANSTSIAAADISSGCTEYQTQKGM